MGWGGAQLCRKVRITVGEEKSEYA
jgi:hypothetical protein